MTVQAAATADTSWDVQALSNDKVLKAIMLSCYQTAIMLPNSYRAIMLPNSLLHAPSLLLSYDCDVK